MVARRPATIPTTTSRVHRPKMRAQSFIDTVSTLSLVTEGTIACARILEGMARTVAFFASLTIALGLWTEVRAGTLPNISGTWYANGNPTGRCHVSQSGNSVTLSNERGATATGHFVDPSTLSTDWGGFNGGRITGTISSDLRRITWSNGTYWSRPSTAPLLPTAAPATPTPTPKPTPEPLRVRVMPITNNHSNPIYIYAASLANGYRPFTYAQCVSYRNLTTKVATAVDFSFVVTNRRGEVEADYGWADKGTFTPPINIDDHCFSGNLWPASVVRGMTNENVRVTQVVFADGTAWRPGKNFLRGYATSGEALAKPTIQVTVSETAEALPRESANGLLATAPYRLRTPFTGSGKCLDVINDGADNRLTMAPCGDYSGQKWWGESAGHGQARLRNRFTGSGKCLDVIDDGQNDRLAMADCGDHSGQMWWAEEASEGYVRLKNTFTGSDKCLDIVNDGRNNRLRMADCGNYSAQRWSVGP